MADLLGVKLVTATIARISQDCARRFQGFADVVRDHVAAAPVKHMDETGFRIGGRTQCAASSPPPRCCTFYRRLRQARQPLDLIVAGIVVHDHWKPYYTMPGVRHASSATPYHLRELKALVEIEKEDWARQNAAGTAARLSRELVGQGDEDRQGASGRACADLGANPARHPNDAGQH